jgi:ankyrin repeat protein
MFTKSGIENYKREQINRAMEIAVEIGDATKVREAVKLGASPDYRGGRAVAIAARNGALELVRLMFELGATPETEGAKRALRIAGRMGYRAVVVLLLVEGVPAASVVDR